MSLLSEPPLDIAAARSRLEELRARVRVRLVLAALLVAAGVALVPLAGPGVGIPALIGAGASLALAALSRGDRRRLLTRLVAQDDAWSLPDVRAHARELVSPRERSRLARSLELAAQAGEPGFHDLAFVRSDRAWPVAGELRRLARAIGDPAVALRAPAAALCRRLLCEAAASPLYNPNLPEADLRRLLGLIGGGLEQQAES